MNSEVPEGTESTQSIRHDLSVVSTLSHAASQTVVTHVRRLVSRYSLGNEDSDKERLLYFPKKVFQWIYSFSLVLLMILTLAFAAVTPIDVIIQTSGASSSAIKMFIVIADCVVFVLLSAVLYFSRILQGRIAMNDIPSKSVYIPFEGDLPPVTTKLIDSRLRECISIRDRAGPLQNDATVINHPGLSPPEYVQRRNINDRGEGSLLPPNIHYEDIVRSIGDNLIINGRLFTAQALPENKSFKEIIFHIHGITMAKLDHSNDTLELPDILRLVDLYELLRFGPGLIKEEDIFSFIVEFDDFIRAVDYCHTKYPENVSTSNESTVIYNDTILHSVSSRRESLGYYEGARHNRPEDCVAKEGVDRKIFGPHFENGNEYEVAKDHWMDDIESSGSSYQSDASIKIHKKDSISKRKPYSGGSRGDNFVSRHDTTSGNFAMHSVSSKRSSGNSSDFEDLDDYSSIRFYGQDQRHHS